MTIDTDDEHVSTYVCVTCDIEVTALCLTVCPLPPRCATCLWLDEFVPDLVERERLRQHLNGL